MATYPYYCVSCGRNEDIIKSMRDAAREEICPQCEITMNRIWVAPELSGASVQEAEYNPALGCVTKNKRHRTEIAKRKGLQEIGNDYSSADSYGKHMDATLRDKLSWG